MRIALAQVNTTVGDLENNYRKLVEYLMRAREVSADIVAFPELAITGYPPEDLLLKRHFVQDNQKVLKMLIEQTANITAMVGFVDSDGKNNLYNAVAVIHDRRLKGVYHKILLPNYGVFDEKRYFVPGRDNKVFSLDKITVGVSVCEDIWTLNGPCRQQAKAGSRLLINISSSPFHAGKGQEREKILAEQAKTNKVFVCYNNLIGGQDELIFDGGSMIFDPKGKKIASAKSFEEDLAVADLDIKPGAGYKKGKLTRILIAPKHEYRGRLSIPGRVRKRLSKTEEIYKALVLGTRDYAQKNNFKKAVIGLSGGIDSSLTAVIACDALGHENVIGISLPSQYTSEGTRGDAKQLAKNLNIRFIEVPIKDIYDIYLKTLTPEFSGQKRDITEENLQARIRGNIIMAFSNKFGWLVLTTGNKSEVAVGYATLYGDMAGGFNVIKDVTKTTVYELARYRNGLGGKKLIPQTVLDRAPSAELRENQKDEDTLPPYDVLDSILKDYVELDKSLFQMNRKKDHDLIVKIIEMVDKNEYKRRQAPPGIKLTPKAFGRDRRCPITNRYKEY